MSEHDFRTLIGKAADGPLTRSEAEAAFGVIMEGEATPSQIGGFLMALRTRGEVVEEYAAAAAVMRAKCNRVTAPEGAMDIVGTGGDGKGTLNISTATAFVVAGAGVTVATARITGTSEISIDKNGASGSTSRINADTLDIAATDSTSSNSWLKILVRSVAVRAKAWLPSLVRASSAIRSSL